MQSRFGGIQILAYILLVLLLAGCGSGTAATPVANTPATVTVPTEAPLPSATAGETLAPTPEPVTPTAEPTLEPGPEPTEVPASTEAAATADSGPTMEPFPTHGPQPPDLGEASMPPAQAKEVIADRATEAIQALKNKDMERLAALVHPEKGLSFSPYSYADDTNLTLTREELANAFTSPESRNWGAYDGSGDPIELTFEAYYDRFIYNHDFAAAPNVNYNEFLGVGNTPNNSAEVYPGSISVEYHFRGFDPQYDGMDWQSLILVFEKHTDGAWYLVHVAHGQWTI
ncbi:MAG TPA: hypothetical protein VND68_01760 [Chloroflexia bacterium]|nr:hypothetical protein [Chloroflexia bacterium]